MTLVIAHRGASAAHRENTVEAFVAARELGADWVELDVHLLADGALGVHHDPLLGDGRALADLAAADLPAHVPLLPAALDACAGMGVNVEVKGHARTAAAVLAVLDERGGRDEVLVSSFDWAAVDAVRAAAPGVPTALLAFLLDDPARLVAAAARRGCAAVHPHVGMADPGLVAAAHGAGLAVNVWTVDDPVRMAELVAAGVDGIVTNVPDVARQVVDAAQL
jgi:glycerophosphoryl diester phosphodiesterase